MEKTQRSDYFAAHLSPVSRNLMPAFGGNKTGDGYVGLSFAESASKVANFLIVAPTGPRITPSPPTKKDGLIENPCWDSDNPP